MLDTAAWMGITVVTDLQHRFDEVLAELEAAAGWQASRVRRPVLILGQLDGVLTGIRQLRRLQAPWNDWRQHVVSRGRFWARVLADLLLGAKGGEP
jgi:hypothetical protein